MIYLFWIQMFYNIQEYGTYLYLKDNECEQEWKVYIGMCGFLLLLMLLHLGFQKSFLFIDFSK